MGLLTTALGALPKPRRVLAARWRHAELELDDAGLRAIEDAATRDALTLQAEVGLDAAVDGGMDRSDPVTHFALALDGFDVAGLVRVYGNRYFRKPVIVSDVRRGRPISVERFRYATSLGGKPVRPIVTGPYTMAAWSFDEHYRDRSKASAAIAAAIADEIRELVAAGARDVQIDEPALGERPEEIEFGLDALRPVLEATGEARAWLRTAAFGARDASRAALRLPVDVLAVDATVDREGCRDLIASWPEGTSVALGVVDGWSDVVESDADVRARVEPVLEVLPGARVWLCPNSDLRAIGEARARAKLETLVRVARSS